MERAATVLIADSTEEFTNDLSAALQPTEGFQVVGTAADGEQAIRLIGERKPDLLVLDEHTAALDPKTADKVLQITEEIVARDNLTTLMVTHNMKNAIQYGNRLIMMDAGRVVVDIRGEEKKNLTVRDLLEKFNIESDRMLLSE